MAVTHKIEISFDPLSDLTPTWTDVSSRLLEVPAVKLGVDDDLSDMQAGSATFRLDNRDRALEPGYAAGAYHPNVRPLRRIRYLINDGSTDWPQFFGYIVSWGPEWPGGMNQEATISAVDGTMILEMDKLPGLDPPAATTYEEVVMHDEPFAFYRLAEQGGTAMVAVAGNEGVYKNTPAFGQPAQIMGDAATSIEIGESEYGQVAVDTNQFVDAAALSVEIWMEVTNAAVPGNVLLGPFDTPSGDFIFAVAFTPTEIQGAVRTTGSVPAVTYVTTVTDLHHVVMTWDGSTTSLYVDGVLRDTAATTGDLVTPDASPLLRVGGTEIGASGTAERTRISNAAFFERALSSERVMAHYQAGAERGLPAQLAGERVAAVADSGLWDTADVQAGTHEVAPIMFHGQSRFEAVKDAVRAESPMGLFYFHPDGGAVYLDWDYGDTYPYNVPIAHFGNDIGAGERPFLNIETTDEDEVYNIVTAAREGGLAQTATDTASVDEFYARSYDITGLIHTEDMSCMEVSSAILAFHSQPDPPVRIKSMTLTGDDVSSLAELLQRRPGHLVKIKHRPKGGTAIDIVARILARTLSVAPLDGGNRVITCTWTLSRGFDASAGEWRAGIVGFSEAGDTTVAA